MSIKLHELPIEHVKTKQTEWMKAGLSYTASGYGNKIPTSMMIFYEGRWRRVYCRIFSNIGTTYVICKGMEVIVH